MIIFTNKKIFTSKSIAPKQNLITSSKQTQREVFAIFSVCVLIKVSLLSSKTCRNPKGGGERERQTERWRYLERERKTEVLVPRVFLGFFAAFFAASIFLHAPSGLIRISRAPFFPSFLAKTCQRERPRAPAGNASFISSMFILRAIDPSSGQGKLYTRPGRVSSSAFVCLRGGCSCRSSLSSLFPSSFFFLFGFPCVFPVYLGKRC